MRAAGPSKNNANLGNRRDGKAAWTRLETGFNLAKSKVSQETFLSKKDQRRMVFGPPWVTNTHLKILDETTRNHFRPATVTEISKYQRPASGHCGKYPCTAAWCWGRGHWNPLCQPWLPRLRLEEAYWPWHDFINTPTQVLTFPIHFQPRHQSQLLISSGISSHRMDEIQENWLHLRISCPEHKGGKDPRQSKDLEEKHRSCLTQSKLS